MDHGRLNCLGTAAFNAMNEDLVVREERSLVVPIGIGIVGLGAIGAAVWFATKGTKASPSAKQESAAPVPVPHPTTTPHNAAAAPPHPIAQQHVAAPAPKASAPAPVSEDEREPDTSTYTPGPEDPMTEQEKTGHAAEVTHDFVEAPIRAKPQSMVEEPIKEPGLLDRVVALF